MHWFGCTVVCLKLNTTCSMRETPKKHVQDRGASDGKKSALEMTEQEKKNTERERWGHVINS